MEGAGSATIIVHPKYPEEGGNHSRYYMEGSGSATIIAHPKYPEEGETSPTEATYSQYKKKRKLFNDVFWG